MQWSKGDEAGRFRRRRARRAFAAALAAACASGAGARQVGGVEERPAAGAGANATALTDGGGEWRGAGDGGPVPFSAFLDPELGAQTPVMRLAPPDLEALEREDAMHAGVGPMRIGVGRAVGASIVDGEWAMDTRGNWVWRLEIESAGAEGIRVHFDGLDLPPGAELMVCEVADAALGREPRGAGAWRDRGPFGTGEWWSPTLFGARCRVEVRSPAWLGPDAVARRPMRIESIQHLYRGLRAGAHPPSTLELPCHPDVSCFPEWSNVADAVGRYTYIRENESFVCTGTLLNTVAGDLTPYFLTAEHCISTMAEAQSAEVFWRYQTAACDGPAPNLALAPRSQVMTLVRSGAASDYSLNMVEGALPPGVRWAGWDAAPTASGLGLVGIHHPGGSYKRVAVGARAPSPVCWNMSNYLGVNWSSGTIEQGSSGSGAFRTDTGALVAHATGACVPFACENEFSVYGSFARSYAGIQTHLGAGSDDVLEPNDSCAEARGLSLGGHGALVVKSVDEDWYGIVIPGGRRLVATATFTHAFGDIDLELVESCGGAVVASSNTSGGLETVSLVNGGAAPLSVRLRVFLASDTRNSYALSISETGACPGDANGDSLVDFADLNIVLSEYGQAGALPGDVNGDGVVDFLDLNLVLAFFGTAC